MFESKLIVFFMLCTSIENYPDCNYLITWVWTVERDIFVVYAPIYLHRLSFPCFTLFENKEFHDWFSGRCSYGSLFGKHQRKTNGNPQTTDDQIHMM